MDEGVNVNEMKSSYCVIISFLVSIEKCRWKILILSDISIAQRMSEDL